MNFQPATVILTYDEYYDLMAERSELIRLRKWADEQHERDMKYVAWSTGGGMVEAVLAGAELNQAGGE